VIAIDLPNTLCQSVLVRMPVDMEFLLFRRILLATLLPIGIDSVLNLLASLAATSPQETTRKKVARFIGTLKCFSSVAILRKLEPPAAVKSLARPGVVYSAFDNPQLYKEPQVQGMIPRVWNDLHLGAADTWHTRIPSSSSSSLSSSSSHDSECHANTISSSSGDGSAPTSPRAVSPSIPISPRSRTRTVDSPTNVQARLRSESDSTNSLSRSRLGSDPSALERIRADTAGDTCATVGDGSPSTTTLPLGNAVAHEQASEAATVARSRAGALVPEVASDETLVRGKRNKLRRAGEALHSSLVQLSVLPQFQRDLQKSTIEPDAIDTLVGVCQSAMATVMDEIQRIAYAKAQVIHRKVEAETQLLAQRRLLQTVQRILGDLEHARDQAQRELVDATHRAHMASLEHASFSVERSSLEASLLQAESKHLESAANVVQQYFMRIRTSQDTTNNAFVASYNKEFTTAFENCAETACVTLDKLELELGSVLDPSRIDDIDAHRRRVDELATAINSINTKLTDIDTRLGAFQVTSTNLSIGMVASTGIANSSASLH
jgi:hypothetical protein